MRPPRTRSSRTSESRRKVRRQLTGIPMSTRRSSPSTRATVSRTAGMARRPSAAQSRGGGGMNRRASDPPVTCSESAMSTAAPLPSPPARKRSSRALSGPATRDTLAAPTQLSILQLPVEDNLAMSHRQLGARQCRRGGRSRQGTQPRRARDSNEGRRNEKHGARDTALDRARMKLLLHYRVLPENESRSSVDPDRTRQKNS